MKLIEKYENLDYYSKQILTQRQKLLIDLSKAQIEMKLENIQSATWHIEDVIKNLNIETFTFRTIFELSIFLNRFKEFLSEVEKIKEQLIYLKKLTFEELLFLKYFNCYMYNETFNIQDLEKLCLNDRQQSMLHYIFYLVSDKTDKKYIDTAYKLDNNNLAAAVNLLEDNRLKDLKTIKKIYENQIDIFEKVTVIPNSNRKKDIIFMPLGGGDDIGASCYLIKFCEYNILIDAGSKFTSAGENYPDFHLLDTVFEENKINVVILTHAHLDHCGALVELYKYNKNIITIMTSETKELLKLNLYASLKSKCNQYILDELLENSIISNFNVPIKLFGVITIEMFKAGHILGAMSLLIESEFGNIFFTDDYCIDEQYTIKGIDLPKNKQIDILITENTYGNKLNEITTSRRMEYIKFIDYVVKQIKQGKKLIIPTSPIGTAQEVLCILKQAALENDFRIYLDGLAVQVNELYQKYAGIELKGKNIYYVSKNIYGTKKDFIKEEFMNNKSCMITSSGTFRDGNATTEFVKQILSSEQGVCILTGYQADNTIGVQLKSQMNLQCKRYLKLDGTIYNIKSELVEFKLSAHCTIQDILAITTILKPKTVVLIHGNSKDKESYIYNNLKKVENLNVIQSKNGEEIFI